MRKLSKYQHGVVDIEDCTDPDLERVNVWSGVVQFVVDSVDNHLLDTSMPADIISSIVLRKCDFMDYEFLETIENTSGLKVAGWGENSQLSFYQSQLDHFRHRTDVKSILQGLGYMADQSTGDTITVPADVVVYSQYGYVTQNLIRTLVKSFLKIYAESVIVTFKYSSSEKQPSGIGPI